MHRALIEQHFKHLNPERSAYFAKLAEVVEAHPDLGMTQNVAFLVLEKALFCLPLQMEPEQVADRLDAFLNTHQSTLRAAMYSREFLTGAKDVVGPIGMRFAAEISSELLELYNRGEISEGRTEPMYRFAWPDYERPDFPYADPDDEPVRG